jgi:hypothetical protein
MSLVDDASDEVVDNMGEIGVILAVEVEDVKSSRSFAGWGITPPGNDAAKRTGSSLHSGHISDPFLYA